MLVGLLPGCLLPAIISSAKRDRRATLDEDKEACGCVIVLQLLRQPLAQALQLLGLRAAAAGACRLREDQANV